MALLLRSRRRPLRRCSSGNVELRRDREDETTRNDDQNFAPNLFSASARFSNFFFL